MTRLGGVGNVSCKVLELYHMDACVGIFNLINLCEALSLSVDRMERLITTE